MTPSRQWVSYTKENISPPKEAICGLTNTVAPVVGIIILTIYRGRVNMMDLKSSFNVIIGHPTIHGFKVIPS